ncbi:MAG TPA: ATP-binding cassette domain-containing protein [Coriobacteriia bacterium]
MLLQARDLTVSRIAEDVPVDVLRGVDLEVAAGTLTDVVGPSGCGKTTLLLALARLLPEAKGELELDGRPASAIDPRTWRTRVAYLPQHTSLVPGTVADNLMLPWSLKVRRGATPPSTDELRAVLDRIGMSDVGLERDAARLSVGQAARVALLRAVLSGPAVLLLDEPDASLDDASAAEVARITTGFVAGGGAAVRVRHARVDAGADRRLVLGGGRLSEASRD